MTPNLQSYIKNLSTKIYQGYVLEVGSADVNGSVRQYFTDAHTYTGVDMADGPGVDIVCNGHVLSKVFPKESFDTVLCLETLEHDIKFWLTIEELYCVLKPGGTLIISTPAFGFPYHAYPTHPYLFSADAYKELFFIGCDIKEITTLYDTAGNPGLVGWGVKL